MEYTQKSDMYSLGLVLWEIIASGRSMKKFSSHRSSSSRNSFGEIQSTSVTYASIPFSECKSQQEICERVSSLFYSSLFCEQQILMDYYYQL
jgi:hypothetical protein